VKLYRSLTFFLYKHFKEGLPLYLSSSATFLSSQGDRVTTAYLLGSYYLGLYQFSALVAGVPSMVLGSMSGVLSLTASFYKALGGGEKKMPSLSFRVLALISFLAVIISIPVAIFVVD
jgi:O-antigen/teichoic acid export membrane protein